MKFLVPNYSCLQNSWLGGYCPQIPILSVLCPQLNLLNPPLNKIPGYATATNKPTKHTTHQSTEHPNNQPTHQPTPSSSSPANQEIPCLLWNPRLHYHDHKSFSIVPIFSHNNHLHTFPSYFFKTHISIILSFMPMSLNWSPSFVPLTHSRPLPRPRPHPHTHTHTHHARMHTLTECRSLRSCFVIALKRTHIHTNSYWLVSCCTPHHTHNLTLLFNCHFLTTLSHCL
jgi:hypothetical protein